MDKERTSNACATGFASVLRVLRQHTLALADKPASGTRPARLVFGGVGMAATHGSKPRQSVRKIQEGESRLAKSGENE